MYECVSHKLRRVRWRSLGTPWDGLILCLAGDALRKTYYVSCRGRLETDLFCVLQGTPGGGLILCLAGDALRQTCVVQGTPWDRLVLCRGRLETELCCAGDALRQTCSVLQWTPWDGLILCLAGDALRQPSSVLEGICQLPAKANSAELITALRRRLGEWKYVPTY